MSDKINEPISLKIKKKWVKNRMTTSLLIILLVVSFIALNLLVRNLDLPKIDVTENKVYTLSEKSIKEIKNIDKDVKLYVYGFTEESALIDLLKQYKRENEKISYDIVTEQNNKGIIEKYGLEANYSVVIVEVEEKSTLLDTGSEFYSYDYSTGQQVDLTEQKITNAILNLVIKNKPKVYILSGHGEYPQEYLGYLSTHLINEAYECGTINLLTQSEIPADCDLLIILSPQKDFLENETNMIVNYINNGGNIILTQDTMESKKEYPNYKKILDLYGVDVENGFVYETAGTSAVNGAPYLVMPQVEQYHDITSQIYSDGGLILPFVQRIKKANDEKANSLNVEYETLLTSSEESYYITDLNSDPRTSLGKSEKGSFDLAVIATKTINPEAKEEEVKKSELLIIGNGTFVLDTQLQEIPDRYVSQLGSNLDFMINSIAHLTERTDSITIRKEMNSSTYMPTTKQQDTIVQIIIFGIPALIIVAGIIVWNIRKKKK